MGGQKVRKRENLKQVPCPAWKPTWGLACGGGSHTSATTGDWTGHCRAQLPLHGLLSLGGGRLWRLAGSLGAEPLAQDTMKQDLHPVSLMGRLLSTRSQAGCLMHIISFNLNPSGRHSSYYYHFLDEGTEMQRSSGVREPLTHSGKVGFDLKTVDAKLRLFLLHNELSAWCFLGNEPRVRDLGFMAKNASHPHKDEAKREVKGRLHSWLAQCMAPSFPHPHRTRFILLVCVLVWGKSKRASCTIVPRAGNG